MVQKQLGYVLCKFTYNYTCAEESLEMTLSGYCILHSVIVVDY